jgi:Calcineurin-like phosphoesterase.
MTAWIKDNINTLNIKAALCTGDLVDQNECIRPPFPRFGNLTSKQQWDFVSKSFERLDNYLPYIICTGNHDYGYTRSENPRTEYPKYFTVERNNKISPILVGDFPNRLGVPSLENSAFFIGSNSLHKGWDSLLIITIEYGARDEVLEWAYKLCTNPDYKNCKVILLTHSYLAAGNNAKRLGKDKYKMENINGGEDMWNKLVKKAPNIGLVICGHYAKPDEKFESAAGFRTDKNDSGKIVNQMMFNTQAIGGGMSGNGGDGWLRVLEFMPDGETINVITYSPLFGFSKRTKHLAIEKSPCNSFSFKFK